MIIKSIGTGNAFSEDSSSFLIINENHFMLFDAGYGVFKYLQSENILDKVQDIFISHTHFDHIADLERIVFFRYFILGKYTNVYAGDKVIKNLNRIFENTFNKSYENGEQVKVDMVRFYTVGTEKETHFSRFHKKFENSYVAQSSIEVNHVATECYGLILEVKLDGLEKLTKVLISGDTKASKNIVDLMKSSIEDDNISELIVLHDFSDWDNPFNNVHCCLSDYNHYYKKLVEENPKIKFYKYHNNCDPITIEI